jgi:hypothetical protein
VSGAFQAGYLLASGAEFKEFPDFRSHDSFHHFEKSSGRKITFPRNKTQHKWERQKVKTIHLVEKLKQTTV